MKNLFYVCLVAILSLGSTGFTTVEETSNVVDPDQEQECTRRAIAVYDIVLRRFNRNVAMAAADGVYEECMN